MALAPSRFGQRRVAARHLLGLAGRHRDPSGLRHDRFGTGQVADQLEDLAEVEHRLDSLAALEQRHQAFVVVDRGGVGVPACAAAPARPRYSIFLAASSLCQ